MDVIVAPTTNQPFDYRFQSQELQEEHDLNWYAYRYRNYDPAIGRFFNVDPLSESFAYNGVYNFSENRVVDAFELEGLEAVLTQDQAREAGYTVDAESMGGSDVIGVGVLETLVITGQGRSPEVEKVDINWGPLVSRGIDFHNGWKQGQQDFVMDTYRNFSHDFYTDEYWEGKALDAYNFAQLNSDPYMKAQMGMSIYNASAYDWGHFGGYQGSSFATSYVATAGLGELGSLGSVFGRIKIPKFGVNKPAITVEATTTNTVSNAGKILGDFAIPRYYTYTNGGKSVFVHPHAMKHLEELATHGAGNPGYLRILGQTHQKALHSAIDDVMSRGPLEYRKMYYSGGNEIMFGAPKSPSLLPAVIHFR